MRQLYAILLDSLLDTLDRRSLLVLIAISALFWLLSASTGFAPAPFADAFRRGLASVGGGGLGAPVEGVFVFGRIEPLDDGRYRARVGFDRPALARDALEAVRRVEQFQRGERVTLAEGPRVERENEAPLSDHEATQLLERVCARRQYGLVAIDPAGQELRAGVLESGERTERVIAWYVLTLAPEHPRELAAGGRVELLFGVWSFPIPQLGGQGLSFAEALMWGQAVLVSVFGGTLGMALVLIFSAQFFPTMLESGAIDLLLVRPLPRLLLFWGRFLGGLLYVAIAATALIGGCWLAFSLRTGFWNIGFLGAIPSLIGLFTVLYAIQTFWAVATRSAITSLLLTLACWGILSTLGSAREAVGMLDRGQPGVLPPPVVQTVETLYWILPSTADFDQLTIWCIAQAPVSTGLQQKFLAANNYLALTRDAPLAYSLASTAAFTLLTLSAACWLFCKREF